MIEEIWKVYKKTQRTVWEVSNYGNVKMNGEPYECEIGSHGYKVFSCYCLHKVVAELFIPNPENKPEVDHIDTNQLNNHVSNLRWVTREENQNNPLTRQHIIEAHIGILINCKTTSKPVLQFTKEGIFVDEYPSTQEAQRQTRVAHNNISRCCNGYQKTAGGFVWRYKDIL